MKDSLLPIWGGARVGARLSAASAPVPGSQAPRGTGAG